MKLTNQILAVVLATMPVAMFAAPNNQAPALTKTEKQVRHELLMLPFLSIYDNVSFQVDGDKVTLSGHVIRPTLKTDAERVVRRLEGVSSVENNIELLPLSPFDNALRLRVAQAIYGYGPLNRYALGAQPPIRIIVKNGNVTLEGVVGNAMDRNLAFIRANGVSGVFSVTNSLGVSAS
ncbi:MAG: BON domain-containing protein [Acidobacteria bacterium]|jgi:hyperosmotically inducible protein|nr:BON domain-containing protein [Acidobacteriota bacterium]